MTNNIVNFKGIKFHNYNFKNILMTLNKGGYLVAPAASALYSIDVNKKYYLSLKSSRVAVFDSGFFCILLRLLKNIKVKKNSGYLILKKFLNHEPLKNKKIFLVDPNNVDSVLNKKYLIKKNFLNTISYVAPKYKFIIKDQKLLRKINFYKPHYVIINIGGETQEILALYLKNNLKFKTSILCTGAAIAFLTKRQAPINDIVDRFYLGWFVRLIYNPKIYFPRVLKSLRLIKLFF